MRGSEVGKKPRDLKNITILRVYRGSHIFDPDRLDKLASGDTLVFVASPDRG